MTNVIFYVKKRYVQHFEIPEHSYNVQDIGSFYVFTPLPCAEGQFEMLNEFACLLSNIIVLRWLHTYMNICIYAHGPLAYCIEINTVPCMIDAYMTKCLTKKPKQSCFLR